MSNLLKLTAVPETLLLDWLRQRKGRGVSEEGNGAKSLSNNL
jgi:hypothetical protein